MMPSAKLYTSHLPLLGSFLSEPTDKCVGPQDPHSQIVVTIALAIGFYIDELLNSNTRITLVELDKLLGAETGAFAAIESFAALYNLTIVENNDQNNLVKLKGQVLNFEQAFQVSIHRYIDKDGEAYFGRVGMINVPEPISEFISAVLGLDSRPQANSLSQIANHSLPYYKSVKGYLPTDVAQAYGFPKNSNGAGQCIAIVELGGGYLDSDLDEYFKQQDLKAPEVSWVGVDGAVNSPTIGNSYDKEVAMNIQVAGSIANGAKIVVYFAPNTEKGFLNAVSTAIYDRTNKPSIISISWGAPEKNWTQQSLGAFNELFKIAAVLGISICAATGNKGVVNGINDGKYHVDFPASSPYVLSCGGTRLIMKNKVLITELPWFVSKNQGSGGGISDFFSTPDYQANFNLPPSKNPIKFSGRGVPDVAANADPTTGYRIVVHGVNTVIGGTSSVAPLFAGLIARVNENNTINAGFINRIIYARPECCRSVDVGNFYSVNTPVYKPQKGWDACTGLGILNKIPMLDNK